jgi:hypothetical protein
MHLHVQRERMYFCRGTLKINYSATVINIFSYYEKIRGVQSRDHNMTEFHYIHAIFHGLFVLVSVRIKQPKR